ncbi:MAG: hypothetical protein OXE92_10180 [Bacteroidetes bacterium]|nr:hypothetical protein [Bacteroidota bacterium]MCY4206076.1 hypothetical protein [Bacteroidota bacterium]
MRFVLPQIQFDLRLKAILILWFWASCSSPLPPPSEAEQEIADAALETLSGVQVNEILNAFNELSNWAYTRHDHIQNRSARQYESSKYLINVDSEGLSVMTLGPDTAAVTNLSSIVEAIMPEESPHLMERFKDDFSYHMNEDTSYWSYPAHKIIIKGRPGSTQDIVTASYVYDAASRKLISASFHTYSSTILFEELSYYQIQLRPTGTAWVPYRLNMHVTLRLPFGQQQVFARNVTFYNYIARPTG